MQFHKLKTVFYELLELVDLLKIMRACILMNYLVGKNKELQ